ncbi:hypothetical protein NW752_000453 [Fusarium irregulare]|jgi:uncharacterized protein (DUF952 family)|uniref:DUF952 domain-containing protein n=1 Tax=Fusarium irregulare TaxID=2494466 RepID=A0A9W8PYJ2_9HYPO|nr:hypothetical protein NW766_001377 [Fusarium irregulare]KAJ4028197.1 hypothetical protein NW752_000453 [Fusarium irregulare]
MSAESPPKYIYKIIPSPPEDPFPKEHPLSDLDRNDGFVHLSTSSQVPKTADLFFTKATSLWVIKLEYVQFADSMKWEGGFPHLYGNFGADHVDSIEKFAREQDQTWGEVMAKSNWLE